MYKPNTRYAIIGAGNGGQTIAGYLGFLGYEVKIYGGNQKNINKINEKKYIELNGYVNGFGKISLASTNIEEVIKDTDVIMVVNPSIYHREIAIKCAPFLNQNQIIFLHPGGTFGAFEFKKTLQDFGCNLKIPIAESNTLIYVCRIIETGKVYIAGKKNRLLVATLPAIDNIKVCKILQQVYPEIEMVKNVLVTSFDNTNPIIHPAAMLLNTELMKAEKDFLFYYDGFNKSINDYVTQMDKERIEIAKLFDLEFGKEIFDIKTQYQIEYNTKSKYISDIFKEVEAYNKIYLPKDLNNRYIYEDIPMGLIPLANIADMLNLKIDNIKTTIKLGELMTNQDFSKNSRTLENLGLNDMTVNDIILYSQIGEKN